MKMGKTTRYTKISKIMPLLVTALILVACGTDSDVADEPDPAADGAAVWNHLEQENYQENWQLWPGTEELAEGQEPHGALVTVYTNSIGFNAAENGIIPIPDGAIIVKENYMPDGELGGITTMYKVDGFNPDHNDWFWLQNDGAGMIDAEGTVGMCQSCHQSAANDYIFTEFPGEVSENSVRTYRFEDSFANIIESYPEIDIRKQVTGDVISISSDEITRMKEWVTNSSMASIAQ